MPRVLGCVWNHVSRGDGRWKRRTPPNVALGLLYVTVSDSTTTGMNYKDDFVYFISCNMAICSFG